MDRRSLLMAAAAPLLARGAEDGDVAAALRNGGCVIAFRHALAPGTFDPTGFRLGDCSTQRNLNDEGRAQARRIGAWFTQRGLVPAAVRSSPWCRCVDTAQLAFGRAEPWPALGSPRSSSAERSEASQQQALKAALRTVPAGRFDVWVTHQFVLTDLVGGGTTSGEGLVLRAGTAAAGTAAAGTPEVLARLRID